MTNPSNSLQMSDSDQYADLLETRKRNAKVLILGSYSALKVYGLGEKVCEERLKRLKAFLIAKGFENTRLVKNWMDEDNIPRDSFDEHFRGKSFHYIDKWAEILIFVFFKDADNVSVTREWGHMIESSKEKCKCSTILWHQDLDLGSIVRGDIGGEGIRDYSFEDENELHEVAFSGCFHVLYYLESDKQTKE